MSYFIEKGASYSRKKCDAIIPSDVYHIPLQKGYLVGMVRHRESETKWSPGSDPAHSGSTELTIPPADNYPTHGKIILIDIYVVGKILILAP